MRPHLIAMIATAAALAGGLAHPAQAAADEAPGTASCPASFSLTAVGDIGGTAEFALALSESGWVVGTARTGTTSRPQVPIRQRIGSASALGLLDGATFARAMGVNNRGTAVGEAFTASPESSRAARWESNGRINLLPGLDGAAGVANAINNRGDVVGSSSGRAVIWPATGKNRQTVRALPRHTERSGAVARATDVDENGTVVGSSTVWIAHGDHDHATPRAMRWDVGAVTHLGGLTDDGSSVALAVSGHHVVGEASSEAAASEAVYFSGGEAQALAALGRWTHSRANDVNADGLAVGHESRFAGNTSFGGTAVMWCGGIAVALADLVSDLPAGWELRSAEAVNAAGQVVGYGSNGQETVSFLLSPVDQ